jgi:hypothetical protein
LLFNETGEDSGLLIDIPSLAEILNGMDTNKPAIAVAHHPFDCLEVNEQSRLERLLKECNTVLYLCGHRHYFKCNNIKSQIPHINLWECIWGSKVDNPYRENGFMIGKFDSGTGQGLFEGYRWSGPRYDWLPDIDFSFPQMGAMDGIFRFPERSGSSDDLLTEANGLYREYLKESFGTIQVQGSFSDDDDSEFAFADLFLPFRFSVDMARTKTRKPNACVSSWTHVIIPPGSECIRLVIFSGSGGGKTTFLKQLTMAYGTEVSHNNIKNHLAKRDLFPIWIDCKGLIDETMLSIPEIVYGIPDSTIFAKDTGLRNAFYELVNRHIHDGTSLFLIDGLEKINNVDNRREFIYGLNKFIEMNENVNIMITSPSVGYDLIARNLDVSFSYFAIQPLSDAEIATFCESWCKINITDTADAVIKATEIRGIILANKKLKSLAGNPLLLSTLMTTFLRLNKRMGLLTTRRTILYKNIIQVRLNSWRSDAERQIDEAMSELAYIAHH